MPIRGFMLTPGFANEVQEAVQTVRRMRRGGPADRPVSPHRTSSNIQRLRVTSNVPVGVLNGIAYLPALTLRFDPTTANWEPLFNDEASGSGGGDEADAVVFTGTGTVDEGSGSGSGGGDAGSTLHAGDELWGRQVESVDLEESGTWPTFAEVAIPSDNPRGAAFGFFAWLTAQPDSSIFGGSGGACTGTDSDIDGTGFTDEEYALWNPFGQVIEPGYAWVEICVGTPGILEGGAGWTVKESNGHVNRGTRCFRPAYHVYGNVDIPITQADGSNTIVFMRPMPRQPGEEPSMPEMYVFEYLVPSELGAGSGSGCGAGGMSAAELFQNCDALAGCWGVEIGGIFYPIKVQGDSGEPIVG